MAKNLSPTSKSSSGVSYLQIYKSWLKNDQEVNVNSTIPVDHILIKLTIRQVLTPTDYKMVYNEVAREQRLLTLFFDILPPKDEQGFDQLVKILFEIKRNELANDLLKEKEKCYRIDCSNEPPEDVIPKSTTSLRKEQISFGKIIGSGSFAVVHRGTFQYRKEVAVKTFRQYDEATLQIFQREINIMQKLNHDHVLKFFGFKDDPQKRELSIIMELIDGNSLRTFCQKSMPNYKTLSMKEKLYISFSCWDGLCYLHKNNLCHKDISPSNVLVSNDLQIVKICDFGLSEFKQIMRTTMTNRGGGTTMYMPPELAVGKRHSEKSDIYSMGATLCELFSERKFWHCDSVHQIMWILIQQSMSVEKGDTCREPDCWSTIPTDVQKILFDAINPDFKFRKQASHLGFATLMFHHTFVEL